MVKMNPVSWQTLGERDNQVSMTINFRKNLSNVNEYEVLLNHWKFSQYLPCTYCFLHAIDQPWQPFSNNFIAIEKEV